MTMLCFSIVLIDSGTLVSGGWGPVFDLSKNRLRMHAGNVYDRGIQKIEDQAYVKT